MKQSSPLPETSPQFRQLLVQVRAALLAAGCAERLDAEAWLARWLTTPNPAFGGALPRDVCQTENAIPAAPADISAELMGRLDKDTLRMPARHW